MSTQKSAVEIIEETLFFYEEDPNRRARGCEGACVYETDDGRKCAVGRVVLDEYMEDIAVVQGGVVTLVVHLLYQESLENDDPTFVEDLVYTWNESHPNEQWWVSDFYPKHNADINITLSDLAFDEEVEAMICEKYKYDLDKYLKPEYRGHPLGFWAAVQNLHDADSYWHHVKADRNREDFVNTLKAVWS